MQIDQLCSEATVNNPGNNNREVSLFNCEKPQVLTFCTYTDGCHIFICYVVLVFSNFLSRTTSSPANLM